MSTPSRLILLFSVIALVLLGSFAALFGIGVASVEEFRVFKNHQQISAQLGESLSLLRSAEAAEGRYVAVANAEDLKRYDDAVRELHERLTDLAGKGRDLDPAQLKRLEQLVEGEVSELRRTIDLRNASGREAGLSRLGGGAGGGVRASIESQINRMLAHEREQTEAAEAAGGRSFKARTLIFLGLFVLNLAVLVWTCRRLLREARARQAALNEARSARGELEQAGRAKDQFLANLSHELRNPLTPVLAMLSAWEEDSQLPRNLLGDVHLMRRNVELEARLIDDLLDLTRIARGKLSLNSELTDVHELIDAALTVCGPTVREKRLEVSTNLRASRHHAAVDPARVEQVLWNVLKNAAKFTPEGGRIEISTENPRPEELKIVMRDSGIGMSGATLARVFEPFEQGDGEVTRRFGGLGLGMTISKALVECQGGSIEAHSDGPGKGSAFTVVLATSDAPVAGSASAPVGPVGRGGGGARRLRILLVEDHADTAKVLGRVLRSRGHEVKVCGSVASAAGVVQAGELDLLLSDLALPDGTGLDVVRQLRRRHKTPAIALTGYGMEEDISRCRDAGFDGHLTKPISLEKLEAMIGEFTNN